MRVLFSSDHSPLTDCITSDTDVILDRDVSQCACVY